MNTIPNHATVLIVGNCARSHALGWKIKQSPHVGRIYFFPGNAGTNEVGFNFISPGEVDPEKILFVAEEVNADLTIVSSEEFLAEGVVDMIRANKRFAFGPTKEQSLLESSKHFSKMFMAERKIPTAEHLDTFHWGPDLRSVGRYLQEINIIQYPVVLKVDGLASGKGVEICKDEYDALTFLYDCLVKRKFADAGHKVICEEFLDGDEISCHALVNNGRVKMFPFVEDHKQRFEGDKGLMTGGMGAVSPPLWFDQLDDKADLEDFVRNNIVGPVAAESDCFQNFSGMLFPGLKFKDGKFKVLEYNVRFGDPETQVLMRRLKSDLFKILWNWTTKKVLDDEDFQIEWDDDCAICVNLVSNGYPEEFDIGHPISGLDRLKEHSCIEVFHYGTVRKGENIYTGSGRVLSVTVKANYYDNAYRLAYQAIESIGFEGKCFRKDIGVRYQY